MTGPRVDEPELSLWARWRRRRRNRREAAVVGALYLEPGGTSWTITIRAGLTSMSVFRVLESLEESGRVQAWWDESTSPHRRRYRLVGGNRG